MGDLAFAAFGVLAMLAFVLGLRDPERVNRGRERIGVQPQNPRDMKIVAVAAAGLVAVVFLMWLVQRR